MARQHRAALLVFDRFELLDFAGPRDVFLVTRTESGEDAFQLYSVAATTAPVADEGGQQIIPSHSLSTAPRPDVLVLPGGSGARDLRPEVIDWVRTTAADALVVSVCTGAFIAAAAGLLDGVEATTHHAFVDRLAEVAPAATVRPGARYVVNDGLIVSAGITTGIDAALHATLQLCGASSAHAAARFLEYEWSPELAG